jgi:uncharacterized membrane protein
MSPEKMSPKNIKWALGVSLVLNLFLIAAGIGAGVVVHHRMHDFRRPPPSSTVWSNTAKDLTPESRARILSVVKAAALSGEADMDQARTLRAQAATLAGKDPYDANAVAALSTQARVLEGKARDNVEDALIHGMAPLAANERTAVANRMLRPGFRFRRMLGKDDHGAKGEGPKGDGPRDGDPKDGNAPGSR